MKDRDMVLKKIEPLYFLKIEYRHSSFMSEFRSNQQVGIRGGHKLKMDIWPLFQVYCACNGLVSIRFNIIFAHFVAFLIYFRCLYSTVEY